MRKYFLFAITLMLSVYLLNNLAAQGLYYYYKDTKKDLYSKPGVYAIKFKDNITFEQKRKIYSNLDFSQEELKKDCEYVKLKSNTSKQNIIDLINKDKVQFISDIYHSSKNNLEYTFTNRIIVKLKESASKDDMMGIINSFNLKRIPNDLLGEKVYLFELDTNDELNTLKVANQIYESNVVTFSQPDFIYFDIEETSDEYYGQQWNLSKISISDAWSISTGSSLIKLAIVDNGVDINHEDLIDKIISGYNVLLPGTDPIPTGSDDHGTGVAGIASAETNNTDGIAGVGYNCSLIPIKWYTSYSNPSSSNAAAAINWAWDEGEADVINCSWKAAEDNAIENAINNATSYGRNNKGSVVVKSAGNEGNYDPPYNGITFPGTLSNVIAVGATDENDVKRSDSSVGPELDVTAPSGVYAPDLNDTYNSNFTGTSSAAPQVTGLAGLIIAIDGTLTESMVRSIITFTSDDINSAGFDEETGWGRINAYSAAKSADRQFTLAGTLQDNEFWWGNITIGNQDVIVPSGVRLVIHSNATVNLNGHSIISTGGAIIKQTGATINGLAAKIGYSGQYGLCGTVQAAINSYNNHSVYIQSGSFNENITIYNKPGIIVSGVGYSSVVNGISIINSNGADVSVLTTRYLGISNSVQPYIEEVMIVPYSEEAEGSFFGYNSSYISLGDITLSNTPDGYGASFSNCTGLFYPINGMHFENNELALVFYNGSSFTMNQPYFCTNDMDISTDGTSHVTCNNGPTFSGNPTQTTYGNVSWNSYSTCGLSKRSSSTTQSITDVSKDIPSDKFQSINTLYHELSQKIVTGADKESYSQDIFVFIDECKSFITSKESLTYTSAVLDLAVHTYKQLNDYEGMKVFIDEVIGNKEISELHNRAKRCLLDYYGYKKDYNGAIKMAYDILDNEKSDKDLICEVYFSKGLLLEYSLEQKEKASKIYEELLKSYPGNAITKYAKHQLKNMGKKIQDKSPEILSSEKNILELNSSNYPNPFNPTTKISFTLPQNSRVSLKVYDALGREVADLANNIFEAGTHEVEFDASNLASGIYFYTIRTAQGNITKKMLLIK